MKITKIILINDKSVIYCVDKVAKLFVVHFALLIYALFAIFKVDLAHVLPLISSLNAIQQCEKGDENREKKLKITMKNPYRSSKC